MYTQRLQNQLFISGTISTFNSLYRKLKKYEPLITPSSPGSPAAKCMCVRFILLKP